MPKGAPLSASFGRSILVLTPQRALKFTATSLERHYVWLSALAFLSHSAIEVSSLQGTQPAMPALPTEDACPPNITGYRQASNPTVPTLRRHRIQDSIRVAKGKDRPHPGAKRAFTTPSTTTINEIPRASVDVRDQGAEAPYVPRRTAETGKRGHTNQKSKPTPSLRSLTSSQKPSFYSMRSSRRDSASEAPPPPPSSLVGHNLSFTNSDYKTGPYNDGLKGGYDSISRRGVNWNASAHSNSGEQANFFEAIGTVRMEAFVQDSIGLHPPPRSKHRERGASHSQKSSTSSAVRDFAPQFPPAGRSQRHPDDPRVAAGALPPRRPLRANTFDAPSPPPMTAPVANTSAKRENRPMDSRKPVPVSNFNAYSSSSKHPPLNTSSLPPSGVGNGEGVSGPISPVSTVSGHVGGGDSQGWTNGMRGGLGAYSGFVMSSPTTIDGGAGGNVATGAVPDPFEGFESGPHMWRVDSGGSARGR